MSSLAQSVSRRHSRPRPFATLAFAAGLVATGGAFAQEDNMAAPPPLEWPAPASASPAGDFSLTTLRRAIQETGNVELCKILTRDADPDVEFPPGFRFADCDPAIAAKVASGEGSVRWVPGARPLECGRACLGAPTMDVSRHLDRPNQRLARVRGRHAFRAVNVGPTPFDRDVFYGFEVRFECRVPAGARRGELLLSTQVDPPFSDEGGIGEAVADFFLGPLNLSRRIDEGVRAALGGGGSTPGPSLGACISIGVRPDPVDPAFDSIVWDLPREGGLRGPHGGVVAGLDRTATVFIDAITRKPTLESQASTAPLQFVVFLNGHTGLIPRLGTIALAPGETHTQRYCRTLEVDGNQSLQILFTDGIGGAVWSQFPRATDFGNGPVRTITTGRQFFQAPRPIEGVPDLPGSDKPIPMQAREFEVRYRIVFQPLTVAPAEPAPPRGPAGAAHVPPGGGIATTGDEAPPDTTCTKF